MKPMALLGVSQLSACGAGKEALRAPARPEPEWMPVSTLDGAEKAPVMRVRPDGLYDVVPPRAVRRLDEFAKHFIYAAMLAVEDAGVEMPPPERIAVVTGTGYASLVTSFALLDDIILVGDDASSPFKFTTAVNNASASSIATLLDARGPCLAILGFTDVLAKVLRTAAQWLREERADLVIAAAGDEYHPVIGYGLSQTDGWPSDGRVRPLDFAARSFVPGETFAAMVLARPSSVHSGALRVESVEQYAVLAREYSPEVSTPQLLAADGRPATAKGYGAIVDSGAPIHADADLWGGNPSAEALNLVRASLLLDEDGEPADSPRAACVTANPDGSGSVVTVSRG
jgi:3-oxoacyl-(acyl-carrier-protein) synthase